jgi:hypothetical protein
MALSTEQGSVPVLPPPVSWQSPSHYFASILDNHKTRLRFAFWRRTNRLAIPLTRRAFATTFAISCASRLGCHIRRWSTRLA